MRAEHRTYDFTEEVEKFISVLLLLESRTQKTFEYLEEKRPTAEWKAGYLRRERHEYTSLAPSFFSFLSSSSVVIGALEENKEESALRVEETRQHPIQKERKNKEPFLSLASFSFPLPISLPSSSSPSPRSPSQSPISLPHSYPSSSLLHHSHSIRRVRDLKERYYFTSFGPERSRIVSSLLSELDADTFSLLFFKQTEFPLLILFGMGNGEIERELLLMISHPLPEKEV